MKTLTLTSTNLTLHLEKAMQWQAPLWSITCSMWLGFPWTDETLTYQGAKRFAYGTTHQPGYHCALDLIHLERKYVTPTGLYQISYDGIAWPMFDEQPEEFKHTDKLYYLLLTANTWHVFGIVKGQPSISGVRPE